VEEVSLLIPAGDFPTLPVVAAFEAGGGRLVAVHGNVDREGVRARLPSTATVEVAGVRVVVVHGHEHGETARAMLGRQEGAALVVSGHSHRPGVVETGDVTLLNPGSRAGPRGCPG
jgi:putative phosphoesterase